MMESQNAIPLQDRQSVVRGRTSRHDNFSGVLALNFTQRGTHSP